MLRSEECLEKVTLYEEIARAEDQQDIKIYYLALAEHWRTLAQIAVQKVEINQFHSLR